MYSKLIKQLRNEAESPDNYQEDSILMREAADAIEKLSKSEWIPVTKRLPKEGQIVCVSDGRKAWDYGTFRGTIKDNVTVWYWKKRTYRIVKWWMPKSGALPKPPKEET